MKKFLILFLFAMPVFAGANGANTQQMMAWGGGMGEGGMWVGGAWYWLFPLMYLVWLGVGVLAAVWLWQQVTKK